MPTLEDFGRQWREALKNIDYIGEIALGRNETDNFLSRLAREAVSRDVLPVVYAVLAVNCAWHYYDDSGFWKNFCVKTGMDASPQTQKWCGDKIEDGFLAHSSDFEVRRGPFRYVSPILEHSGVGAHYIERFADLFRELKDRLGLPQLINIQCSALQVLLPPVLPKALAEFLNDSAGCIFVNDIARTLWQLETGIIRLADLASLPGYRQEFWPLFYKAFFREPLPRSPVQNLSGKSSRTSESPTFAKFQPPYFITHKLPAKAPHIKCASCFVPPFGKLFIGNPEGIAAGRFAVLGEINGKIRKIPVTAFRENGQAWIDIDQLAKTLPVKMRLWIEPFGRYPARKKLDSWDFFLLGKYEICWPEKELLDPGCGARVALDAPSDWKLSFSGRRIQEIGPHVWQVWSDYSPLRANLVAGAIELPVELPVNWDIVKVEESASILTSANYKGKYIELEGVPGAEIEITISNDREKIVCGTGAYFGGNGRTRVNAGAACGKELDSWPHPWSILSQGTGSTTGGVLFLNLELLYKLLPGIGNFHDQFFAALPENAVKMRQLARAMAGEGNFDAREIENFPLDLQPIAWHGAACSAIIDGRVILFVEAALEKLDEYTRYALEWFAWSRALPAYGDIQISHEDLPDSECLYAPVWIEALDQLKSKLGLQIELNENPEKFIEEWAAAVMDPEKEAKDTILAHLDKGNDLTEAWKALLGSRPKDWENRVWNAAKKLETEPALVGALARLLLMLLLKLTGRIKQMNNFDLAALPEYARIRAEYLKSGVRAGESALDCLLELAINQEKR